MLISLPVHLPCIRLYDSYTYLIKATTKQTLISYINIDT